MMVTNEYISQSFRAMNTDIELLVYYRPSSAAPASNSSATSFEQEQKAKIALAKISQLFEETEDVLSRFRPDTELSRLNRAGYLEQVSPLLFESVRAAVEFAELTGGIFDPTILKALEQAGYDQSFEKLADLPYSNTPAFSFPVFNQYRQIQLDQARRAIRLPYAAAIDLGGIAKGMTVDRAATVLKEAGFKDFMVSAGGDLYLAGSQPAVAGPAGWSVMVQNPLRPARNLAALPAQDCGVATSSITKRSWCKGSQFYHHLIDPRSGQPVQNNLVSVTVVAPSTRLADGLAKTALILGLGQGQRFIEKQAGCAALFVDLDGCLHSTANLTLVEKV